jgi:hypothetical protein
VRQRKSHDVPSHVALPFIGAVHGVHDDAPQLATLPFELHWPLHVW